jgi:hypothetical protein
MPAKKHEAFKTVSAARQPNTPPRPVQPNGGCSLIRLPRLRFYLIGERGVQMNASNVIPFHYQGSAVRFNGGGWINATDVSRRFGKKPIKWLELPSTKSYMASLERHHGP